MFFIGAICAGIGSVAVAYVSGLQAPLAFFTGGLLKAVGHGLYFPNRNFLEFQETIEENRNYYYGLMQSAKQTANVVVPFIAGWLIVSGPHFSWYSQEFAYLALFGFSFVLMVGAGFVILYGSYTSVAPTTITRFRSQDLFVERHALNLAQGVVDGLYFIPPLLVFTYLGNEGYLGTVIAIAGLIAASAMYLYGRFLDGRARYRASLSASIVFVLCAIGLVTLPSPLNALVYVLFANAASDFFLMACSPILLANSDKEMAGDENSRYSFVFDNELFLNIGRVCSILAAGSVAVFFTQKSGLIYAPLMAGVVQLSLIGFIVLRRRVAR